MANIESQGEREVVLRSMIFKGSDAEETVIESIKNQPHFGPKMY